MVRGQLSALRAPVPARVIAIACGAISVIMAPSASAGDAEAGRRKAAMCIACHDLNGASLRPDAPHLSGQVGMYLAAQLRAYRSGARPSEVMKVIAAGLSDEDIDDLAAWYAGIGVSVAPIE